MSDVDERSDAMRGSQEPAAWAAFEDESGESGVTALNREAVEEVAARMGWEVVALYRQPTLTDEEREAIELAIATWVCKPQLKVTLRGLLERQG